MASVRLDTKTEAQLRRLAVERGQTRSEVIRDAIAGLAGEIGEGTALAALRPYCGIADSGGLQLSTGTGRRLRRVLEERRAARRTG